MALPAQTLSRTVDRELFYTVESTRDQVARLAFNQSFLSGVFLSEQVDDQYGRTAMMGRGLDAAQTGIKGQIRAVFGKSPNFKWMAGGWDTFLTAPSDPGRILEFEWKHASDGVTLSLTDELMNGGREKVVDIAASQAMDAMSTVVESATQAFVSGSLATQFTGLDSIISANDSLQGLSGASYPKWNSWGLSGKDTAAASVSFAGGSFAVRGIADMRDAWTNCTYGTTKPHCLYTTEDIGQFYEGALVPQERYTAPATTGDAGFIGLAFKQAPVYCDTFATSGTIYFLNFDAVRFVPLQGALLQWQPPVRAGQQETTHTELILKGQLVCYDRRTVNKVTSVTA